MAKYLILIFGIALLFRFWQITTYPVSLTMDEVAIGYGSYSMLQTGRDEWGTPVPIVFKSVGDYKPPINYYLVASSIKLFGLTEFAVRFPVALIGSLTAVIFVVFLRRLGLSKSASLFGGLWLAILPWHVHHSRYGLEAITALLFLIAGCAAWWTSLQKKSYFYLGLSLVSFGISVWAYHSNRLFVPLLVIFFVILHFKSVIFFLSKDLKKLAFCLLLFVSLAGPFLHLALTSDAVKQRAAMTSILRDSGLIKSLHYGSYKNLSERVFENDLYLIFHHWVGKYTDYFDLRFWFWKGLSLTPPGYPDSGLLYVLDIIPFAAGVWIITKSKNQTLKKVALFWFFVGPLASSFTMNDQHTLRTLVWLPFFGIVVASGADYLGSRFKKIGVLIYLSILLINVAYIKDIYTTALPFYFSEYWQYGFKQAALYGCEHLDKYDRVVISPVFGSLGPLTTGIPDYYVLFYCQYPPEKYMYTKKIDKFEIGRVDWREQLQRGGRALLISGRWDYPEVTAPEEYVIKRLDYFNEIPGLYFVDTGLVR